MIITNILHVSGVQANLYSPSFFKREVGQRKPINPFTEWVGGRLYAYGTYINKENSKERFAIDLRAVKDLIGFTGEGDDPLAQMNTCIDTKDKEFPLLDKLLSAPPIPPSKSFTSWKYQSEIKEHQHAYWDDGQKTWVPVTQNETRYIDPNGKTLVPELIENAVGQVAEELTAYYFINKYELDQEQFVDVPVTFGDDLEEVRTKLEEVCRMKFPKRTDINIKLYKVDITRAKRIPTSTEHDQYLMGYWLEKVETYPRMISVDGNSNIIATYGSWKEPFMEGDFEYRHSLPDAVFDFKKFVVNRKTTLPICNGLCCYPRIVDEKIYANQGQRLSYNKQDRNRRWVLVDFEPIGGCSFVQLKDLKGNLTEMVMPDDYDSMKQSCLLVIKGRLFLPGEFSIDNSHRLLFDITKYTAIYDLDTMLCRGDQERNTIILKPSYKYDLKTDDNSFLIIINNAKMQIVKHDCHAGSWPMTKMQWGSDSHSGTMKFDFDRPARGLLFDRSTRSIIDYTREVQTMTFYADKFRRWGISNTHANWSSLIAVIDESSHNLMSARGFVLDDVYTDKYERVVWPRLSILDFVFRS